MHPGDIPLPPYARILAWCERRPRRGERHARHGLLLAGLLHNLNVEDLPLWENLAGAYAAAGNPLAAARVRAGQVRCLNLLWRSAEALALGATVEPTLAALGTPTDQAVLARALGIAHLQNGAYALAEPLLTAAAACFQRLGSPAELARTSFELARLALLRDDLHAAFLLLDQAHQLFVRLALPLRAAFCVKNVGVIATQLGQPDRAIANLIAARTTFVALGQPRHVAGCNLNLGTSAYHSGLYELALAAWRQADAAFMALDLRGMALMSQRNQAEALAHMGQLEAAEALLITLIPVAEQLHAQGDLREILYALGEVLQARGDDAGARDRFTQTQTLFLAQGNRPAAARALAAQGWLALARNDRTEAQRCFAQAAPDLTIRLIYHWRAIYGLARCAELEGRYAVALAYYRDACAEVAQLRQALAVAHASSALFRETRRLLADALRLAATQADALSVLQLGEQQRALALQQQLQREPFRIPPDLQAEYEARRASLRELALQKTEDSALEAALNAYLEILLHGCHAAPSFTPVAPAAALGGDESTTLRDSSLQEFDLAALRAALSDAFGDGWTALAYGQADDELLALTLTPEALALTRIGLDQPLHRMLERVCLPRYRAFTYQDLPFKGGQRARPWAVRRGGPVGPGRGAGGAGGLRRRAGRGAARRGVGQPELGAAGGRGARRNRKPLADLRPDAARHA